MQRTGERKQTGLKSLLQEWNEVTAEGRAPHQLSHSILKEMEDCAGNAGSVPVEAAVWHECLRYTSRSAFIAALGNDEAQRRWADACFEIIRLSQYTLRHMLEQRAEDTPDRILFEDLTPGAQGRWSYRAAAQQVREIAAAFYTLAAANEPRVAIFSENSVSCACCDLACLLYDILNTPLNPHFNAEILVELLNRLQINIVVTDTEERIDRLLEVLPKVNTPFRILAMQPGIAAETREILHIGEFCRTLSRETIAGALDRRRRLGLDEVATVMFTSGSTGVPKGVSFSIYNLITKRFARAVALPEVGNDETLLCYLPLYHTFGRYFELLGSIYWGGTYVFTGNPSLETLLSLLPAVNPTGLISIPLRWAQIEERCVERMRNAANKKKELRAVIGKKLRWGLSAAGYLDPRVFRFFNHNGVALCSGFGMTEATGGITMTPPWKYVDDTNGLPLPGIRTRLSEIGELEISGHYVARYLEDKGPGDRIPYPVSDDADYWFPTGDLFRVLPNGYYQILDRIKDIYKNDKGQTIAPRVVEREFEGVPGIKRTFLVGDRKAYNVLLIVPDIQHSILQDSGTSENLRQYFRRIVLAANRNVAPYERVVNFTVLDRDFDVGQGELTPKGTLSRRVIERNFTAIIQDLYKRDFVEFRMDSIRVKIPRWFFRDLSILEDDIFVHNSGLFNQSSQLFLPLRPTGEPHTYLIGDLEYRVSGDVVDMGLLARQPRFWIGNPSLIRFCPCREGWDTPLEGISSQVMRPWKVEREYDLEELPKLSKIKERMLVKVNQLIIGALFGKDHEAIQAVNEIGKMISRTDLRWDEIFRRRLEALSRHPLQRIRSLAYQILLLDDPSPDYGKVFPAFIASGLSFADAESMEVIAGRFERYQLEALRHRMLAYRTKLAWPADEIIVKQFDNFFRMLLNFVDAHPDFYSPIRAELATWSLLKAEPRLAKAAHGFLLDLHQRFKIKLASRVAPSDAQSWKERLVFDGAITHHERRRIETLLMQTQFMSQAVMFAFQEEPFSLESVPENGIWVSRIPSPQTHRRYRMSINLRSGRHYDLELVLGEDFSKRRVLESLYWTLALAGHPVGPRVLPRPGCFSINMRARSNIYMDELTAWEKICEFSEYRGRGARDLKQHAWRRLYIQSLTAFFRGWLYSGCQIVPGKISPDNVTVPELDFKASGTIASLSEWRHYRGPLSLVRPMLENFYQKVEAHYPWCRDQINIAWIFDACMEALGAEEGTRFLDKLEHRLEKLSPLIFRGVSMSDELRQYKAETKAYLPLAYYNALNRHEEFRALNTQATPRALEQTIDGLYWLYRLDEFPEYVRYCLYRQTYFADANEETLKAFDELLRRLRDDGNIPAVQLAELSDLQGTLTKEEDRNVFSRLVFPRRVTSRRLEVTRIGESEKQHVVVSSQIADRYSENYTFREPLEPREIGQLYNYFMSQNIPKTASELDRYYVLMDSLKTIVGGICYQMLDKEVVLLDGIVVARTLQGRDLRSAMEEEFCSRMAEQGVRIVRARFFLRSFYLNLGYRVDKRWGDLVKFLSPERPADE